MLKNKTVHATLCRKTVWLKRKIGSGIHVSLCLETFVQLQFKWWTGGGFVKLAGNMSTTSSLVKFRKESIIFSYPPSLNGPARQLGLIIFMIHKPGPAVSLKLVSVGKCHTSLLWWRKREE